MNVTFYFTSPVKTEEKVPGKKILGDNERKRYLE